MSVKSEPPPSEEFTTFDALVRTVLQVPHSEILRREEEYRKQTAKNPHKRGPKHKVKRPAS